MQPCWQAGERLASLSIDNILLSARLSKYWKNICHPTDNPYHVPRAHAASTMMGCVVCADSTLDLF